MQPTILYWLAKLYKSMCYVLRILVFNMWLTLLFFSYLFIFIMLLLSCLKCMQYCWSATCHLGLCWCSVVQGWLWYCFKLSFVIIGFNLKLYFLCYSHRLKKRNWYPMISFWKYFCYFNVFNCYCMLFSANCFWHLGSVMKCAHVLFFPLKNTIPGKPPRLTSSGPTISIGQPAQGLDFETSC